MDIIQSTLGANNEVVNVEMTPDRMIGVISFVPPDMGGRILSYEEVYQAIQDRGIVSGIKESDIRELIQNKKYNYKYIIATGQPSTNGEDAKIIFNFDPKGLNKLRPRQNDDGTVDFKNLEGMKNVKKGELLATKIPATQGVDGYNILGKVLKGRKGKDARLPRGKNTITSEDGLKLFASEEGRLLYEDGKVSVSTTMLVRGDVDSSIGNIDFLGNVVITGIVHSGFRVQAKGSVEVRGPVEGATIIAGGDIILSYGVQGNEESKLDAGGSIIAKFIQNATVNAVKDIVTEGILHSSVSAGGVINVTSGKGSIIGGNVSATNVISAKNIGSPMGALTDIQIGLKPCVYVEYKELIGIIAAEQEELTSIEKEIIYLKTKNISVGSEEFKKNKIQKLIYRRQTLTTEIEENKRRYKLLAEQVNNSTEGVVEVYDKIYPGSKIIMGNVSRSIDETLSRCVIAKDGQDIRAKDLISSSTSKRSIKGTGHNSEANKKQGNKDEQYLFMYGEGKTDHRKK